ncbi:30S ribosomal protein S18 [Candidatus Daviesbacteria bacterium]|nr:30S ribosomal protein S18 [Candidatus Daviesbacteria bacterium]
MVNKKVSKKVTRKFSKAEAKAPEEEKVTPSEEQKTAPSKSCVFCKSKTSPSYTDLEKIKKFITDRNRILPKMRSGLCAKHQRSLTRQIKYARHLALLPFTPKV